MTRSSFHGHFIVPFRRFPVRSVSSRRIAWIRISCAQDPVSLARFRQRRACTHPTSNKWRQCINNETRGCWTLIARIHPLEWISSGYPHRPVNCHSTIESDLNATQSSLGWCHQVPCVYALLWYSTRTDCVTWMELFLEAASWSIVCWGIGGGDWCAHYSSSVLPVEATCAQSWWRL